MKQLPLLLKSFFAPLFATVLLAVLPLGAQAQHGASSSAADETPTFKLVNNDGVTIEAEITKVEGGNVSILLKDGKPFTFPVSMLNAESRRLVQSWAVDQALANSLEIRVRERTLKREKTSTNVSTGEIRSIQLNFTVTNKSATAIDNLRIDLRAFLTREQASAPNRTFSQEQTMSDSFDIKQIAAGQELTFQSPVIELKSEKLNGNIVPMQDNNRSGQDKLDGYWYRVYRGKNLVTEDASPRRLMRTKKW